MNGGMTRAVLWLVLVVLPPLGARDLSAEDQPSLLGSRVRVETMGSAWPLVGLLVEADANSLVIRTSRQGAAIRVSRDDVLGLEFSRGFRRRTFEGVVGGALAWGAIVGLYATFDILDESGVAEPLFIGGLVAAGAVGRMIKTERWEQVPLSRVSLRLSPRWRGVQAEVVLAF